MNYSRNKLLFMFCDAVEAYAQTPEGKSTLAECGIDWLVVRGSGGLALSQEPQLFERPINDIDLSFVVKNQRRYNNQKAQALMPQFFAEALKDSELNFVHLPRESKGLHHMPRRVLPEDHFQISLDGGAALNVDLAYAWTRAETPVEDFTGEVVDSPEQQFVCVHGLCERLFNKLMTLHNSYRAKHYETPHKYAQDILDAENLLYTAQQRGYSHEQIEEEIRALHSRNPLQPSAQHKFTMLMRDLQHGEIYGAACREIKLPELLEEMDAARQNITLKVDERCMPDNSAIAERILALAHLQPHRVMDFVSKLVPSGKTCQPER